LRIYGMWDKADGAVKIWLAETWERRQLSIFSWIITMHSSLAPGYVVTFHYLYTSMFFSSKSQHSSNSLIYTEELRSIIRLFVLFITLHAT